MIKKLLTLYYRLKYKDNATSKQADIIYNLIIK